MAKLRYAILIDCLKWKDKPKKTKLTEYITLFPDDVGRVIKLYNRLCKQNNLDDGEPFSYDTYFVVDEIICNDYQLHFWGPYSAVSRLSSIINICTNSMIGAMKIIITYDDFKTAAAVHDINPQIPEIFEYDDHRIPLSLNELIECTKNDFQYCKPVPNENRLSIALTNFYYSWRASYYYIQTCINAVITLEALFAPHSSSEICHQIAFNLSHFLGKTSSEKEVIYNKTRKYYNLRSQIVHGSMPEFEKLSNLVPDMFRLLCRTLKTILMDQKTVEIFIDDGKRNKLFNSWLFK